MNVDRAVVTGGSGFIGTHLVRRLLHEGWDVTVVDNGSGAGGVRTASPGGPSRVRLIRASVANVESWGRYVKDATVVIHLAATVGVQRVVRHPLESFLNNLRASESVLETAAEHGAKTLLVSSSEVYGRTVAHVSEDDDRVVGSPTSARWSYATAKAAEETLGMLYHQDRGLPVIVVRPFNVVGPGQLATSGMVLPRFVTNALKNLPISVHGDGSQTRTFTYVEDVVTAMCKLIAAQEAVGGIFNVAGETAISIADLARLVVTETGSNSEIVHVPYAEAYTPGFDDVRMRTASVEKLAGVTGFRCQTPIREIIQQVALPIRAELQRGGAARLETGHP